MLALATQARAEWEAGVVQKLAVASNSQKRAHLSKAPIGSFLPGLL